MKKGFLYFICLLGTLLLMYGNIQSQDKPTICILGGTPSSKEILSLIPDSIKSGYNLISLNRPGFGGTQNETMSDALLYKLAKEAGLKKNDFGIIGISGGAPFALLLASHFKLKHCGIISGMVSKEAFFQYGDKTITKDIMETALKGFPDFEAALLKFPNVEAIVKMAGANSTTVAVRACYDEFNYLLADNFYAGMKNKNLKLEWWHGAEDTNVPIQSVELFLKDFPNAQLNKIPGGDHGLDANVYLSKILKSWE